MKQGQLRVLGALVLAAAVSPFAVKPAAAQAKPILGNLAGVVRDSAGTPQMGASVELAPEFAGITVPHSLLTNTQGIFQGNKLTPGLYSLRVTLAGFLPTLQKHVRVSPNLTTVVRVELESMYASLDQLRRMPSNAATNPDDWKWVLRSAASVRPVLEWVDESNSISAVSAENRRPEIPRVRMEFTNGARRAASPSNIAPAPATAVAYDQKLGVGSLIFAGQMSYDQDAPGGGIATVWLPTGTLGAGPHTALVLREAKLGPDGPSFRGVRLDQGGAISFGNRLLLRYGGEYVLVGLGAAASSIRPRAELNYRISQDWYTELILASLPTGPEPLEATEVQQGAMLTSALSQLDAFPALLMRDGRPVLQNAWHEELSANRKIGDKGVLQFAGFHDDNRHTAVYGFGGDALPPTDYFQDYFSKGFAYDGGASSSWGARVAFRKRVAGDTELTALYSIASALAPTNDMDDLLRDALQAVPRHSLGAGISGKVPRLGTRVHAGYKWISGPTVSRLDSFGESLYQMDPYFHLMVRQPLPKWALGRWEAIADCDNLLAQGYVSTSSRDGHVVLVPAFRTFRGGLSVQF
ncbi:MAG TPA: carboxypeptidase-like regulatory domain-containing protein [Candidatus Acidoferrum sp.]